METPKTLPDWILRHAPTDLASDLAACFATRGKRSGRLLASVPTSKGPRIVGCWRSLMSEVAPTRAGLFALMFADPAERAGFEAAEAWLRDSPHARAAILFGSGDPLEFNLRHWHASRTMIERTSEAIGIDPEALGLSFFGNE